MRVRKVDANGDYVFGGDQRAYWQDRPEGVAQVVESRLHLWIGEWYLNLEEGTPYQTQILGKRTENTRDPVLQDRILSTPGVLSIVDYDSALARDTRGLVVSATIQTPYTTNILFSGAQGTAEVNTTVYEGR
jgi:hypothetical protein